MNEAKHTPGPWEADSNGKIWGDIDNPAHDGDSPLLAEMFGNGAEQRANARLIAVAPDLLVLAKAVIGFEIATPKDYATKGADSFSPLQKHIIDIQNRARTAIAKAEQE